MTLCKPTMDNNAKNSLSMFQMHLNHMLRSTVEDHAIADFAKSWLDDNPELSVIDGPMTPLAVYKQYSQPKKLAHGGKRKGAGRKKSTPSKVVRVPEPLDDLIGRLVDLYKQDLDGQDTKEIRKEIVDYIQNADYLNE